MSQASPPKPWERNGAATAAATTAASTLSPPNIPTAALPPTMSTPSSAAPTTSTAATSSTTSPPAIPQRPTSLSSNALTTGASPYSTMNRPGYGLGAGLGGGLGGYGTYGSMGGMGAMGSYTSPYSRLGGGMYGGMGMGGYGMGGGYGGYGGMGGIDPNDPNSLSRGFENSTAATFQMIESIVGAFGGFAQMLESTYMATHSSFFAMVRVAEQFGNLKNTLGSILGIFTILRWARTLLAKVTGRPLPARAGDLTPANFAHFEGRGPSPGPSKKPFLFFVAAVFGLPYLMGKLIRSLAAKQEEEERRRIAENPAAQMDPSKLEFCRVMYDFTPEQNNGIELEVKKGDLVAVLSKSDPMGNPSQWWRCRARDARVGYLPSPYLESIVKKDAPTPQKQLENGTASRAATMTSAVGKPVIVEGKAGDISIESFQKSGLTS
ncbi:Peroxin 13, N-terminal region-domain-containing protein [Trichophaea hybrida]|nr:Peroxin 13, N-terminal region-domain-containing protein [Trichophaea hybrida]